MSDVRVTELSPCHFRIAYSDRMFELLVEPPMNTVWVIKCSSGRIRSKASELEAMLFQALHTGALVVPVTWAVSPQTIMPLAG